MIDAITRLRNRDGSPTKASARASGRSICCGAPGAASISVRDGRSASFRLAGRQAQARQQQLAVLGVAKTRQIVRRDQYGAQLGDDRARFGKPPHMGIARGENAVRVGIA